MPSWSTNTAEYSDQDIFRLMSLHSAPLEGGVLEGWEDLEDKTDNKEEAETMDCRRCFVLELR